jgi:preprotein translocase subunit SecD
MRASQWIRFYLVLIIIVVAAFLALHGFSTTRDLNITGTNFSIPAASDSRFGIDIKGGAYMVFYPDASVDINLVTDAQLESSKQVIRNRLDSQALFDADITVDNVNKRIIVEIPATGDMSTFDAQTYIQLIGTTAQLTFREVDSTKVDANGNYLPLPDKIILTGADIANATAQRDTKTGSWDVALELTSSAASKFSEATGRLVNKPIAIFMDSQLISAPNVTQQITGGQASITMNSTDPKEAQDLAATIRSGSLPFKLVPKQVNSISPLLGQGALDVAVLAGLIAFLGIIIFMMSYYRFMGFVASICLTGLVSILLLIISWSGITLTLPGIAGIILTIGMSVDANVIIYERIREELRDGRTLMSAIEVGYKRGFTAILDGHVTTMISSAALFFFGSGAIKGFATTLFIGIALSFIISIFFSRIIMQTFASFKPFKKIWLYGMKRRTVL